MIVLKPSKEDELFGRVYVEFLFALQARGMKTLWWFGQTLFFSLRGELDVATAYDAHDLFDFRRRTFFDLADVLAKGTESEP